MSLSSSSLGDVGAWERERRAGRAGDSRRVFGMEHDRACDKLCESDRALFDRLGPVIS